MKKADLVKFVQEYVDNNGDSVVKADLEKQLIEGGASASLIVRELGKALKAAGVATAAVTSEEIVALRKDIAKKVKKSFDSNEDFQVVLDVLDENHEGVKTARIEKEIRAYCKENEFDIPAKRKLGAIKSSIIDYFMENESTSLQGLADYLQTQDMDEEKALHTARMNYTFAEALWNHTTV